MRRYTNQNPVQPAGPGEKRGNFITRFIADAIEYVQRCLGVNDVEKRYDDERQALKKDAAERPAKLNKSYGYEPTSKWEK
jgi:hypothetical protein